MDSMKDEDIDYSDIPELDDAFFTQMQVQLPQTKEIVTLRLDPEVIAWFKKFGKGYQTRINAVLKSYVKAHQHKP
jgi:uncharacterized protein (DUF4415 family)